MIFVCNGYVKKNEIELMSRYPIDVDLQNNIHVLHATLNV